MTTPSQPRFRIVPEEPSDDMIWAGNEAAVTCIAEDSCGKAAQHIWADMLAASPSPDGLKEVLIKDVADQIEAGLGPLVGSPEYLADPVKRARSEKRRRESAEGYAEIALNVVLNLFTGGQS